MTKLGNHPARGGYLSYPNVRVISFLFSLVLFAAVVANAQTLAFTASLSGLVTDRTGAVVPGATATLADAQSGFSRTFTTANDGHYSFTLMPPGTYTLQVQKAGFQIYLQTGIVLHIGAAASQDVTLQLGTQATEVTVSAGASILEITNANVATTVASRELVDLPLNFRNPYGLVSLNSAVNNSSEQQVLNAPGSQGTADQDIGFLNFGGGFFGSTVYLLDGAWDRGADWDAVIYIPSIDNTSEFTIQTHAFTAQYGWSTGNIVNTVTKSGNDTLHGDAFEFDRNSAWDANNFFNNAAGISIPHFARNQFGVTLGGPVKIPGIYNGSGRGTGLFSPIAVGL